MALVLAFCTWALSLPEKVVLHFESFDAKSHPNGWVVSSMPNYTGEWKVRTPPAPHTDTFEKFLYVKTPNAFSAISTVLDKPVEATPRNEFVLQFEMRASKNITCSGAYLKLFSNLFDPAALSNETRHFLMFGPDICRSRNQVVFSFNHANPKTGEFVEKVLVNTPQAVNDNTNHLYTLVIRRNGTVSILVDNVVKVTSEFRSGFEPPIVPPRKIKDPQAEKPLDWDDREFVVDTEALERMDFRKAVCDPNKATPPTDWKENEKPFLAKANKPIDWDDELLGEFVETLTTNPKCRNGYGCGKYHAPLVRNPAYCGKSEVPKIRNPAYKGEWKPPLVDNPDFFEDPEPYKHFPKVSALGFELWSVDAEIGFNNILLANNEAEVLKWNDESFVPRLRKQKADMSPRGRVPDLKTGFAWVPVTSLGIAVWQVMDSWLDMYAESKVGAVVLTVSIVLIPGLLVGCCAHLCSDVKFDEEEEASEDDE